MARLQTLVSVNAARVAPAVRFTSPGRLLEQTVCHYPRIVAFGGGTGLPVVLRGLADAIPARVGDRWADRLAAIVTVSDDGGSSGRLRRDFGVLPPGDIRNCLAALSSDVAFGRLLGHRFDGGTDLSGHAVGNLMLTALARMTGSFAGAIDEMGRLLNARGRVFPSTCDDVTLRAELANGDTVDGESAIVQHPADIRRLTLVRRARPWPDALRAIINADVIVVGPGSLYTSVVPNLLVDGVASTLAAVRGIRICVANLMTQAGETEGMSLDDHLRVLLEHTGHHLFDYVLVNNREPDAAQLERYRREGAEPVRRGRELRFGGRAKLVAADLLDTDSDHVRHDGAKLAAAILDIAQRTGASAAMPASSSRSL
jgi:uncharacterized cofD-like protein